MQLKEISIIMLHIADWGGNVACGEEDGEGKLAWVFADGNN